MSLNVLILGTRVRASLHVNLLFRAEEVDIQGAFLCSVPQADAVHEPDWSSPFCRLMNHSCEPSMQPFEVFQRRGYFRILFAATRHIYPGDELTIDYSASQICPSASCRSC